VVQIVRTDKIIASGMPIKETQLSAQATAGPLATIRGRTASSGAAGVLGLSGVPAGAALPSVLATGSPLSVFQYTLSRADRLALYRYFVDVDPFVGRAIELHSELPMSRITISPPKGPSATQNQEINSIYENLTERLGLLQFLLEVAREYWAVGSVYIWLEWDEEILEWDQVYILPVEYCHSVSHPFARDKELVVFSRPLVDTASVRRMTDRDLYNLAGDPDIEDLLDEVEADLPEDLKEALDYGEGIPLSTDSSKGSYVFPLHRNRPPNEAYGRGIVQRCLEALLRLENLKNAQLQISGRNMQPKHLVYGEALSQPELDDLRAQIDLAILDNVDFPIVTNYAVTWNTISANERLLNVDTDYQTLREDIATGLGTTKELLTGQATYGGQRMTLEMMNTQYLLFREIMRDFVERGIFRPVAEAKGHYYYVEVDTWVKVEAQDLEPGDDVIQEYDGTLRKRQIQVNKVYNHSRLRFNRLSIRDNTEVYEQLFQLHQKGSLALQYLLDIHNIDSDENAAVLLEDLATVRDPTFNRLVESIYGMIGEDVVGRTDFTDRVIEGMNLDLKSQVQGEPSPGTDVADMGLGGGGALSPVDMETGLTEGEVGPELGTEPGLEAPLDMGAPILPGIPATVPTAARRASKIQIEADTAARILPGKSLSGEVVAQIIERSKDAPQGKRLTRKAILRIANSKADVQSNGAPAKNPKKVRRH